jgi:hypothetical protein
MSIRGAWIVVVALSVLAISCAANPADPTDGASTDALVSALRAQGLSVTIGETLPQQSTPYFSTPARVVFANTATLQIFEYDTAAAADRDAAKISRGGSPIGTVQISWVSTPHFYKSERVIVTYVGTDSDLLQALEKVLGPPFTSG